MAVKFVVALFESKGIAEDACNRMRTEGVPPADISLMLLRETAPLAATEAPSPDPLLLDDVRHRFAEFIRNGETAVFVCTHSEAEIDTAVDTLRQYAPLRIRVAAAGDGAPIGHDLL
jgi:hypothetical protein